MSVLDGLDYFETILGTVGRTPLVRLRKVAQHGPAPILAKIEFFNPGGSVKDRIGLAMVESAEREGSLEPGGTVVECTSGNTELGLAAGRGGGGGSGGLGPQAREGQGRDARAPSDKIEGVGEDLVPTALDLSLVDRVISCGDRDGLGMTRRLAREEAIFVGGSPGVAVWMPLRIARDLTDREPVVVLLPDAGERYLTKMQGDAWMRDDRLLCATESGWSGSSRATTCCSSSPESSDVRRATGAQSARDPCGAGAGSHDRRRRRAHRVVASPDLKQKPWWSPSSAAGFCSSARPARWCLRAYGYRLFRPRASSV
jgi:hypothetical protein